MIKFFQRIHKFYSTGRWVLRIVVSIHLLMLFFLLVGDLFLDLFNKKKIVYQVQIVSTGDISPQADSSSSTSDVPVKPKKTVVKPKKVAPPKKKVSKPKKVAPPKKKVSKPKKVAPPKKKATKPKKKVRTAADVRRDFKKNFKSVKPTKKRRDLSHLLNNKKVSANDISKRFSQAMGKVKVNQSKSGTTSNYNYSGYYDQLSSYLYGRWKEPALHQNYETTIEVTVSKWGTVLKKRIVKRSGNTVMDNSVQLMLNNLTKLPKLPGSSTDKDLTVQIKIQLEN